MGSRRAWVHRADVLPRPGLVAVQVKPIALGSLPQVAEPRAQLSGGPADILQAHSTQDQALAPAGTPRFPPTVQS